jgi:hypothetical protein
LLPAVHRNAIHCGLIRSRHLNYPRFCGSERAYS